MGGPVAIRGQRPKPSFLKVIEGNRGKKHPIPTRKQEPTPEGPPEKPKDLKGAASKKWDALITRCFWLTWADSDTAAMYCHLYAQFEFNPIEISPARIAQIRALGSELGFNPTARARIGADNAKRDSAKADPADEFLGQA